MSESELRDTFERRLESKLKARRVVTLYDERRELSIQLGGTGDVGKNDVACRTTEECARKATLRDDQASASALFTGALVGAAVAGALTVASGIAWFATAPEKKAGSGARLVPSAGPTGGGLNVVGSF